MKKGKAGRPAFVPTDEQKSFVKAMRMNGVQQDRVAEVLKIDPKTLRLHFRDELTLAKDRTDALVTGNLVRQALKNHPSALSAIKWYQIAFMGKGERTQLDHTGAVATVAIDQAALEGMTNDELTVLQRALGKLGGSPGAGGGDNSSTANPTDYLPT